MTGNANKTFAPVAASEDGKLALLNTLKGMSAQKTAQVAPAATKPSAAGKVALLETLKGMSAPKVAQVSSAPQTYTPTEESKAALLAQLQSKYINPEYVQGFFNETGEFLSHVEEDYGKVKWDNASTMYNTKSGTVSKYKNQSAVISDYIEANKGKLNQEEYQALASQLKTINEALDKVEVSFRQAKDYYGKWKSQSEYDAAVVEYETQKNKLNYDVVAGEAELKKLEDKIRYEIPAQMKQWADKMRSTSDAGLKRQYHEEVLALEEELYALQEEYREFETYLAEVKALQTESERLKNAERLTNVVVKGAQGYDPHAAKYIDSGRADHWRWINSPEAATGAYGETIPVIDETKHMTDTQKKAYYYYLGKDIENGDIYRSLSSAYYKAIETELNKKEGEETAISLEGKPVLQYLYGAYAGLDQFASGIENLFNGKDDYIAPSAVQFASQKIREDLKDQSFNIWYNFKTGKWEDHIFGSSVGQAAYDAITTTANMAPSILSSVAVGMFSKTAGAYVGSALLGASAAGNAYQEVLNMGYGKEEARAYATAVGVSEAVLEKVLGGIGALGGTSAKVTNAVAGIDKAILRFSLQYGGKIASEALEEGIQSILEPMFKNATLNMDESVDWNEVAYSALLGGIMGGTFGAVDLGVEYKSNEQLGKTERAKAGFETQLQNVLAQALQMDAGSDAYRIAQRVQEKLNSGKEPSNVDIGELYRATALDGGKTLTTAQNENTLENKNPAQQTVQDVAGTVTEQGGQPTVESVQGQEAQQAPAQEMPVPDVTVGDAPTVEPVGTLNSKQALYEKLLQMKNTGGNQNGQEYVNQPVGAENLTATQGDIGRAGVFDGEQGGTADASAYEQVAPVAGRAGQSQRTDGRRAAFERENRNQAIRDSVRDVIPRSPAKLGIPGGEKEATLKVIPVAHQTEEMKRVDAWFAERGVSAYFFVGSLTIQKDGKQFTANGMLHGDRVFIRADSPNFDLEQIAEHEKFHLLKRENPGMVEQLMHELQEKYSLDAFKEIVDKYIKAYGSVVDMSREGAELRIWNEILADAYAGMNARIVDVAAYQDDVAQRVQKYTGESGQIQSNGVRQTNGPNSQTVENEAEFAIASAIPGQTQNTGYDYSQPFAEQVEDFERGTIPKKDTLIVCGTPEVFRKIGLTALPMTINQKHVDYALHGTKDFDHYLGKEGLKQLPDALEHPVAIISSKTKNGTSLVAMLEIRQNGKQVIVPVVIDGFGVKNGLRIDSHAITSVYGKDYSISRVLWNALENEAKGKKFSVYYVDIKKATGLLRGAKVLMPKMPATSPDGYINSITDPGSPVKPRFSGVTETQQFKRWFGDWQKYPNRASKIVNTDGTPRVMYHGSPAQFTIFDKKKAKSSGQYGRGFYFTNSESHAGTYGQKYSVYLNIRNPLEYGRDVVSREQVRSFLETVAENEDYSIENYGTYDLDAVLNAIMGQNKTADAFQVIQDINATAIGDMVEATELFNQVNNTEFDGIIAPTETVAFYPNQIKSATSNIGTFDGNNPDIEFALGSEPVDADVDFEERMQYYANVPEYTPGMERNSTVAEDPDVDEMLKWDQEFNSERQTPSVMRNVPKSEFVGTPHLRELGVQIENSVGDYWGTAAAVAHDKAAKQMKRQIKRAEMQLNATEAEKDFAAGIAAGRYYAEDIPGRLNEDVVLELADYYAAEAALDTDMLREKRASIASGLFENMKTLFKDSDAYAPSRALVLNYRTPERNMLKIFGEKKGKEINDKLFTAVAVNEAERYRFMNRMFDEVRTFEDSEGKRRELTKEERAMVMMHIEGKAASEIAAGMEMAKPIQSAASNIAKGDDPGDAAREWGLGREERRLAEQVAVWIEVKEAMDSGKIDAKLVDEAAKKYSEMFNKFYDAINDFLVAHGYETIGFVRGYAPHIQPEQVRTTMNKAFHKMGIDADVGNLPASIAGMTADFKPNKRWNPHMQHRRTIKTQYDIAKAFESYVEYMSDILYHTDDIMRVRQAANYFRRTYAPEEIKNMLEWAEELRKEKRPEQKAAFLRANGKLGDTSFMAAKDIEEQFNEFMDEQYQQIENAGKYSELVKYLENYANILAGKQSYRDRGAEANGREIMAAGNKIVRTFAISQVAGSISSALNQTAQLPQIIAEVGDVNAAHALWDIASGKLKKAAWAQESDFLVGKEGIDFLVTEGGEKMISTLFKPASFVDGLISTLAVRGEYLKQVKAGKTHEEAMKLADKKGTAIMGSRMKGSKPVAFHAKNFWDSIFNVFQIEALNSWEHLSQDLPRDFHEIAKTKGKKVAAAALAGVLVKMVLAAFVINRLDDELYGGTPAPFDVLGLTANFIASGEGLTTNQYLCTVFDNAWEKMTGVRPFNTDASEIGDGFDWGAAVEDTVYNISNEIPFLRNASALLGAGDDTLPLPDVAGTIKDGYEAILEGKPEKLPEVGFGLLADVIPGGRQLEKTAQGLEAYFRGGKYSGYGENAKLQYPVEQNAVNFIKAALFGRSGIGQSEFYASGGKTLTRKQTETIEKLEAVGYDGMAIYDMILGFRDLEPKEGNQNVTELQKYVEVAESPWPDDMKSAMLETMMEEKAYGKYKAALDAGVTTYEYFQLMDAISELEPEEGKKGVTDLQKFMEVAEKPWSEEMKEGMLAGMMGDSQYREYQAAREVGISTYWYFDFLDRVKGLKKDKVVAVIAGMKLNAKQKDTLYFLQGYAESGLKDTPWH